MDWNQACTIIGVLGLFNLWFFIKLEWDMKESNARQEAQIARIDQIYGVILSMLRDGVNK